jgi:hypothetical protein
MATSELVLVDKLNSVKASSFPSGLPFCRENDPDTEAILPIEDRQYG